MNIRLATISDLVDIELIYNEAVKHMNDEGNYLQWIDFDSFKTGVINYIENNNFYVVSNEKEIVGMFALIYGIDKTYNDIIGEWENNDEYVTIHKIAVKYFKNNIASFIFNFIENKIINEGIYNIRIDTHKDNYSMKTLLKNREFRYCGIISITCNYSEELSLREAYIKDLRVSNYEENK